MSRICCVLVMAVALLVTGVVSNADAQERSQVKLVLQITVDGLRGDLLRRYGDRFGEGGFRSLWLWNDSLRNGAERRARPP